jgi:hypothetical protein
MRLLGAELRTLRRPLLAVLTLAFVALVVALALDAAWSTDELAAARAERGPGDLEGLVEPIGPDLAGDAARDLDAGLALRDPLATSAFAAGHAASLPGAVAVLVLAAAQVGGAAGRRTGAQVLLQQGARVKVLAARALSLWLAAAGMLAAAWAALALVALGLRLAERGRPPLGQLGSGQAAAMAGSRVGAALAVLAAFTLAGVLAGVLAGSAPGAACAGLGALTFGLGLAQAVPALGRANPAAWVAAVMGFRDPTFVPDHLWVGLPDGASPGPGPALAALAAAALVAAVAAAAWYRMADVPA